MVGADGHSSGFVFRLKHDGALDPAFNTDGIVFSGGGFLDAMVSVAIQSDGKIVTAGSQDVHWSRRAQEMRLRRFMPDGRIDASFGVGGTSTGDFQDMVPSLSTRAMARQADGKLVVVGDGTSLRENRPGLAVARFVENDPDLAGLIGLLAGKTLVTGNEKTAELVVRRTGGSSGAVSVAYETVDGSALAGSDYVPKVGRLEWADGDTSQKSIPLVLIDDGNHEQERFSLQLFDSTGGAILALQTATIWSGNIPELGLALERKTIGESDGSITLRVSRSGSASGAVSVDFATYPITAKAGSDFTSAYGTLTWRDGQTAEKTITVLLVDDSVNEGDEWFGVSLSNPTDGAILGTYGSATVTIADDDAAPPPPPPGLGFTLANASVGEADGSVVLNVSRSGSADAAVSVSYATSSGSAAAGSDFASANDTLSWAAGDTANKTIIVNLTNDGLEEDDETFTVTLSNPSTGVLLGSNVSVTVTIVDDDSPGGGLDDPGKVGLLDPATLVRVVESNRVVDVYLHRSQGSTGRVSVRFQLGGGTASPDVDFAPSSGTVTWEDGELGLKSIPVEIFDDMEVEGEETIPVRLLNPPTGGATLSGATTSIAVADNDSGIGLVNNGLSVQETGNSALLTVFRSGDSSSAASVNYATSPGSATAGSDFTSASGTLDWAAGDTSNKTVSISITNDSADEGDETFMVTLSNPSAGMPLGSNSTATVTIVDDDTSGGGGGGSTGLELLALLGLLKAIALNKCQLIGRQMRPRT